MSEINIVADSLIREYLKKHNLLRVLTAFEDERVCMEEGRGIFVQSIRLLDICMDAFFVRSGPQKETSLSTLPLPLLQGKAHPSIPDRTTLRNKLALTPVAKKFKRLNPTVDHIPSALELWVSDRLERIAAAEEADTAPPPLDETVADMKSAQLGVQHATAWAPVVPKATIVGAGGDRTAPPPPAPPSSGLAHRPPSIPSAPFGAPAAGRPAPSSLADGEDGDVKLERVGRTAPLPRMPPLPTALAPRMPPLPTGGFLGGMTPGGGGGGGGGVGTSAAFSSSSSSSQPLASAPIPPRLASTQSYPLATGMNDLHLEDADEFGFETSGGQVVPPPRGAPVPPASSAPPPPPPSSPATPLDLNSQRSLQQLVFGKNHGQAPPSWRQGFYFDRTRGCESGLVQREGGPCGALAAVQALTLSCLYQPALGSFSTDAPLPLRLEALSKALALILWQCASAPGGRGVASILTASRPTTASLSFDAVLGSSLVYRASSEAETLHVVKYVLGTYSEPDGWGLVLFVLSAVLSRGVVNVNQDMDMPETGLMGSHLYCTQELVNLLLTGRAVSNVFNGEHDLDGARLRGLSQRGQVGFLTLLEFYRNLEVGSFYKQPACPVWVICSESHYTTLWSANGKAIGTSTDVLSTGASCDVCYYDGLARQEGGIRLTLRRLPGGNRLTKLGDSYADRAAVERMMIPPLELVIETRWPGVTVDWNGTEPIL